MRNIRKSVIAGTWYPGDPEKLKSEVKRYLDTVKEKEVRIDGEIIGLIAPHAGYMYSGPVAAYAYRTLKKGQFKRVLILAPSHRFPFNTASVYFRGAYETPLGVVPVDEEICENLKNSSSLIDFYPQAHSQEHSLEIQLPFLQYVLGDFHLIPIIVGGHGLEFAKRLADAIYNVVKGQKVLIVASTDLSHFYPYNVAVKLDRKIIERVEAGDAEGLANDLSNNVSEACGGWPVVAAMLLAKKMGADAFKILHYANSGDVTGDKSSVVGYMAAVMFKRSSGSMEKDEKTGASETGLTDEEKETLRRIAWEAIKSRLEERPMRDIEIRSPRLKEKRGAFVTLHKNGQLRGCIGYLEPIKPLYITIKEVAQAAAFSDPRFMPLKKDELDQINIEISVLTPLQRIHDINEIEIGKHGIYVKRGLYSGVLLPQVATEQGWGRLTFLEHTCLKAGLPPDEWRKSDTEIYIFSAEIF